MNTNEMLDAINDAGLDWREYSGRGMYGKRCIAIEIDSMGELFGLGQELPGASRPSVDQLGLKHIVYWPRCTLEAEIDETEASAQAAEAARERQSR